MPRQRLKQQLRIFNARRGSTAVVRLASGKLRDRDESSLSKKPPRKTSCFYVASNANKTCLPLGSCFLLSWVNKVLFFLHTPAVPTHKALRPETRTPNEGSTGKKTRERQQLKYFRSENRRDRRSLSTTSPPIPRPTRLGRRTGPVPAAPRGPGRRGAAPVPVPAAVASCGRRKPVSPPPWSCRRATTAPTGRRRWPPATSATAGGAPAAACGCGPSAAPAGGWGPGEGTGRLRAGGSRSPNGGGPASRPLRVGTKRQAARRGGARPAQGGGGVSVAATERPVPTEPPEGTRARGGCSFRDCQDRPTPAADPLRICWWTC